MTLRGDRSVPLIAEELGINPQTLYGWRRDFRRKGSKVSSPETSSRQTQAEEIAGLRKELKREMNATAGFNSYREAELLIFDCIQSYYNRKRRHSALGYCSPVEFERGLVEKGQSAPLVP